MRNCKVLSYLVAGGKKTVYQRSKVAVRDPAALLTERVKDNLHVEYPVEEIARRMSRVRHRHALAAGDHMEQVLLCGEYKYFMGKRIHFIGAEPPELISLLQNFSYFGLYSTKVLQQVLVELHQRVDTLNPEEVTCILNCVTRLARVSEPFLDDVSQRLLRIVHLCTSEELAGVLEALDVSQSFSSKLLEPVIRCAEPHVQDFDLIHVAGLSACLGRLCTKARGQMRDPTFQRIGYQILNRAQSVLDHDCSVILEPISKILWGLAKANYLTVEGHHSLLRRWVQHVSQESQLPVRRCGSILGYTVEACSEVQCYDESIVLKLAMGLATQIEDMDVSAAASSMSFLSKATQHSTSLTAVTETVMDLLYHIQDLNFLGNGISLGAKTQILAALATLQDTCLAVSTVYISDAKNMSAFLAKNLWSLLRGIMTQRSMLHWGHLIDVFRSISIFECLQHEPTLVFLLERVRELQRVDECREEDDLHYPRTEGHSVRRGPTCETTAGDKDGGLYFELEKVRTLWKKTMSADSSQLLNDCIQQR